jgi:hypothetical protein
MLSLEELGVLTVYSGLEALPADFAAQVPETQLLV